MRHAVGTVVQISQTEILRDEVLQLANELAIAAAHKMGVSWIDLYGRPLSRHGVGGIGIGARRKRVKIDVHNGVAARNAGSVRTSKGHDLGVLTCSQVHQQRARIVFEAVAAVERGNPEVGESRLVMLPGPCNNGAAGRRVVSGTQHR